MHAASIANRKWLKKRPRKIKKDFFKVPSPPIAGIPIFTTLTAGVVRSLALAEGFLMDAHPVYSKWRTTATRPKCCSAARPPFPSSPVRGEGSSRCRPVKLPLANCQLSLLCLAAIGCSRQANAVHLAVSSANQPRALPTMRSLNPRRVRSLRSLIAKCLLPSAIQMLLCVGAVGCKRALHDQDRSGLTSGQAKLASDALSNGRGLPVVQFLGRAWNSTPAQRIDIGLMYAGDSVSRAFVIKNGSNSLLTLNRCTASCDCCTITGFPLEIESGGEAVLVTHIDGSREKRFSGELGIEVIGFDGQSEQLRLEIDLRVILTNGKGAKRTDLQLKGLPEESA
jgi:hypothetical protein